MLPDLLTQIPADQDIAGVTADGACDTRKCDDAMAEHGADAVMPPGKNATPWKAGRQLICTRKPRHPIKPQKINGRHLLNKKLVLRAEFGDFIGNRHTVSKRRLDLKGWTRNE